MILYSLKDFIPNFWKILFQTYFINLIIVIYYIKTKHLVPKGKFYKIEINNSNRK